MNTKKYLLIVPFLALTVLSFAGNGNNVDFSIQFYNKKIYFLGDLVWVEAVVSNNSTSAVHFKIADNRFFSIDFTARTETNISLNHSKKYTIERSSDQPVFFREINLEPGEKYGVLIELSDFIAFKKPGVYIVEASFYPGLYSGNSPQAVKSNRLILDIRPPLSTPEMKEMTNSATGVRIERKPIPPDEVVAFTLSARQKSQWERFFLYFNLEKLILRNPERSRVYRRLSEENKRKMILRFKDELREEKIDKDILTIPSSFKIIKTTYTPFEGAVEVIEKFKYSDYTEIKKYTYYLERKDRYWQIINYEIQNLGTE